MTKNHIKRFLKSLTKVKTWQLLLIFLPMFFISATFLRLDHLGMTSRLEAVLTADKEGTDDDIKTALNDLKTYVFSHITVNILEKNGKEQLIFGTGTFYLENQYMRDATKSLEEAQNSFNNDDNPNGNVYKKADEVCSARAKQYGWHHHGQQYFDCILSELASYPSQGTIEDVVIAPIPPASLYRYDFASPVWYPDLAGLALLISALLAVVIITRLLIYLTLRIILIFLKKSK
jgi:hypothetical protein